MQTKNENYDNFFRQHFNYSNFFSSSISGRADIDKYYEYWEIAPKHLNDRYYVLAQTQGLLPTDNFEFIAEYNPIKDLKFISEISGLSHIDIPANTIKVGDELSWTFEDNKYDKFAVHYIKGNRS